MYAKTAWIHHWTETEGTCEFCLLKRQFRRLFFFWGGELEKITVPVIRARKGGERITMLTAYDFPFAQLIDGAGVDVILVGDSLGNVVLGYPNTLPVTLEEMIHHTSAVVRGVKRALVVADMPFMSYHESVEQARRNAGRLIKETNHEVIR